MNKLFFIFIILIQIFLYIIQESNDLNDLNSLLFDSYLKILLFNDSLKILLFNDTCIYVTENSDKIYKIKVEENIPKSFSSTTNIKDKTLIKISNESFIMFALNNNYNIYYCIFNINDNELDRISFQTLRSQIFGNYII